MFVRFHAAIITITPYQRSGDAARVSMN